MPTAGLARDPDDLPAALAGPLEPLEEEAELEVPAHERAQASPAEAEAGGLRPHEAETRILHHHG